MCLWKIEGFGDSMPEAAIAFKVVRVAEADKKYASEWGGKRPVVRYCAASIGGGWGWDGESYEYSSRDGIRYSAGVHAYVNRPLTSGDINYAVVRVLLRGPLCKGLEGKHLIVVYREMTILSRIKERNSVASISGGNRAPGAGGCNSVVPRSEQ